MNLISCTRDLHLLNWERGDKFSANARPQVSRDVLYGPSNRGNDRNNWACCRLPVICSIGPLKLPVLVHHPGISAAACDTKAFLITHARCNACIYPINAIMSLQDRGWKLSHRHPSNVQASVLRINGINNKHWARMSDMPICGLYSVTAISISFSSLTE